MADREGKTAVVAIPALIRNDGHQDNNEEDDMKFIKSLLLGAALLARKIRAAARK